MHDEHSLEGALAFARTLKSKTLAEAIGQLHLAFGMDFVSAKALMLAVTTEKVSASPVPPIT